MSRVSHATNQIDLWHPASEFMELWAPRRNNFLCSHSSENVDR